MTTQFPRRMFRWAAIYGLVVLTPMLLLTPLPLRGAEVFIGFVGLALVFQAAFWIIGGDPVKYRALMPVAVAEKMVFGLPTLALYAQGRVDPPVATFAGIDVLLGIGFWLAWKKTPRCQEPNLD